MRETTQTFSRTILAVPNGEVSFTLLVMHAKNFGPLR